MCLEHRDPCVHLGSFTFLSISCLKVKSGVKRKKADTTTPSSTVNDIPPSPVTPIEIAVPYLSGKVRSRRESHRSIKRPKKDLPGEDLAKVNLCFKNLRIS